MELSTEQIMNGNVVNMPEGEIRPCDQCGARGVRSSWKDEKFFYGEGSDVVELSARVPVWTCEQCGFGYTDGEAEEAKHEAVCNHLRVLPPAKIRFIRECYGLTQAEFARLTGFGVASMAKCWETGALIQGQAANRFLRLLAEDKSLLTKLEAMDKEPSSPVVAPVFRTIISAEARAQASVFILRPAA